jgi:hypothetical protein
MNRHYWEILFPNVRFTDKIKVEYSDGTTEMFKHLYFDNMCLEDVDWKDVVDCYEV